MRAIVSLALAIGWATQLFAQSSIFDDSSEKKTRTPAAQNPAPAQPPTPAKPVQNQPPPLPSIPPAFEETERHRALTAVLLQAKQNAAEARRTAEFGARATPEFKAREKTMNEAKAKLDRSREQATPEERLAASAEFVAAKQNVEKMLADASKNDKRANETSKEVSEAERSLANAKADYESWRLAMVERQIPDDVQSYFANIEAEKRLREADFNKEMDALLKEREAAAAKLSRARAMDVRRPPGLGITDVGGIDQKKAAARQSAMESANRELAAADKKIDQLNAKRDERTGEKQLVLRMGSVGAIGDVKAIQIVDGTSMIVQYRTRFLWITKFPTRGIVEDAMVSLDGKWEITRTRRYTAAAGGTRTIFLAEPFAEPFIEYKPLVEFVKAARQPVQKDGNGRK